MRGSSIASSRRQFLTRAAVGLVGVAAVGQAAEVPGADGGVPAELPPGSPPAFALRRWFSAHAIAPPMTTSSLRLCRTQSMAWRRADYFLTSGCAIEPRIVVSAWMFSIL